MNNPELVVLPTIKPSSPPLFQLGNIYCTPGALETLERLHVDFFSLLYRHVCGDWGCVCKEYAQANKDALRNGTRILSAYELTALMDIENAEASIKVWLITEADRSATTLLLPEEY